MQTMCGRKGRYYYDEKTKKGSDQNHNRSDISDRLLFDTDKQSISAAGGFHDSLSDHRL